MKEAYVPSSMTNIERYVGRQEYGEEYGEVNTDSVSAEPTSLLII